MQMHPGNLADKPPLGQKGTTKEPKPKRLARLAKLKARPKRKSAAARAHLAAVAALPCVICWRSGPSEVHHVICGRFSQRKASDFETIPLCARCHRLGPDAIHAGKESWVQRHGADHEYLSVVADLLAGELTK